MPNLACQKKLDKTVGLVVDSLHALESERGCSVQVVVVGLPLMMNGSQGLMADEVKAFVSALDEQGDWKVVTWDERLTSVQAERSMRDGGMNRKRRAKRVDGVSATIILQNYLDSKSSGF
jgi:putative Holliday junction resolvase